jgi:hypothetical protein
MKTPDLDSGTVAIVAAAVLLGVVVLKFGADLGKKAGDLVTGTVDLAGGLLSGNNPITEAARTDAYQDAGIIGTLGAATDIMSGGTLSTAGESLGGWFYDLTHPAPTSNKNPGYTGKW